ncbi:MAG TPA: glycosyltransferase [Steroidobacteraceae bacterium]|nr:glycosyltransferase [Steroidobacteraceae bacterium]
MKVLHVITSLSVGGAETMLRNVALGLDRQRYQSQVLSLTGKDPIGLELERAGVAVTALHGRAGLLLPGQFASARHALEAWQPDVIHAWMYHANVMAQWLAARQRGRHRPVLITSVRGALNSPRSQKRMLRLVRRVDALLSARAAAIIFNSHVAARQHVELGYAQKGVVVVPNGFDIERFRPRPELRARLRSEMQLGARVAVGVVARFDPLKGHELFLRAVAEVTRRRDDCAYVLVGRGCDASNETLRHWIVQLGLKDRVVLLGERSDVSELVSALDFVVCPSLSESFPNAVGEAMACGRPCIVTDVGDCAYLVGDTGWVVPPQDDAALAGAIERVAALSEQQRQVMGARARSRIEAQFALDRILAQYAAIYERALAVA